jgi:hypothetical protein
MGAEKLALLDDVVAANPGRMYEVNIDADPARFLDWDAPIEAQSPEVMRIMDELGVATMTPQKGDYRHFAMGGQVYRDMENAALPKVGRYAGTSPVAASRLRDSGIPGIKYFDGDSRLWKISAPESNGGKWEAGNARTGALKEFATRDEAAKFIESQGSRNYVVFDDSLVTILRKYGVAGLAALPAGVLASMGMTQEQAAEMDANRAY